MSRTEMTMGELFQHLTSLFSTVEQGSPEYVDLSGAQDWVGDVMRGKEDYDRVYTDYLIDLYVDKVDPAVAVASCKAGQAQQETERGLLELVQSQDVAYTLSYEQVVAAAARGTDE